MSAEPRSHGRSPWRDAYEMLVQRPGRGEPVSDVTITRNAKGVAQFEVTVRGVDPVECQATALALYDGLVRIYPYPVESAVSPSEAFVAGLKAEDTTTTEGRYRARVKAAKGV